jgi:integrase
MSVKLREKKLSDGRISLYLDIYHNRKRNYDFLEIYLEGKRSSDENKEKLRLANKIRIDTEHQLTVQKRGLPNEKGIEADLFAFMRQRSEKKRKRSAPLVGHLGNFAKANKIPFRLITKEWLLAFQTFLTSDTERIGNTVNNYMALLNTVLNEAEREEVIPFNPWKKVPSHLKTKYVEQDVDPLEPGEIRLMIEKSKGIHPQVVKCFLVSIFTGLRWGDASNLLKDTIRSMDVEGKRRKFIVFTQGKTKGRKNLPLNAEAIRILAERLLEERREINNKREAGLEADQSPYFFPALAVKDGATSGRAHSFMNYHVKKWAKQTGLKKRIHYHLTRHTFATLGLEKIGDLGIISSLLGHKKLATTQRYAHVLDRLKIQSIDRMSSYGILR